MWPIPLSQAASGAKWLNPSPTHLSSLSLGEFGFREGAPCNLKILLPHAGPWVCVTSDHWTVTGLGPGCWCPQLTLRLLSPIVQSCFSWLEPEGCSPAGPTSPWLSLTYGLHWITTTLSVWPLTRRSRQWGHLTLIPLDPWQGRWLSSLHSWGLEEGQEWTWHLLPSHPNFKPFTLIKRETFTLSCSGKISLLFWREKATREHYVRGN